MHQRGRNTRVFLEYSLGHACMYDISPMWHLIGILRGIASHPPWHLVGIRLASSWHLVGICLALVWHRIGQNRIGLFSSPLPSPHPGLKAGGSGNPEAKAACRRAAAGMCHRRPAATCTAMSLDEHVYCRKHGID